MKRLLIICLLIVIGLIGCSTDDKKSNSLTTQEQVKQNENKKELDSFTDKLIKASEKSKASKTLDINSK